MPNKRMVAAFLFCLSSAHAQAPSPECQALKSQLDTFFQKNNPYRPNGPHATLETIQTEFGAVRVDAGDAIGSAKATLVRDGCVGEFLIDEKGLLWLVRARFVPLSPTPRVDVLEQLAGIEISIRKAQEQLNALQVLRATVLKQAMATPPVPIEEHLVQTTATNEYSGADSLLASHRYEEAASAYTQLLNTHTPAAKALLRRAYCYYRLNRFTDAISGYTDVIRLNERESTAIQNRALAYLGACPGIQIAATKDRLAA